MSASRKPNPKNELRLQKYLAECGFGSRRACEDLIARGSVTVDGQKIREQGTKVVCGEQRVLVDGRPAILQPKIYLLLYKPRGYLCTSKDPQRRKTYRDLLPKLPSRTYSVGRLDFDSEGLLIVTNDGEFCNLLTHPRHGVAKTYSAVLNRRLSPAQIERMRKGIKVQGEPMRMEDLRYVRKSAKGHIYRIILKEGKNRQIRKMIATTGAKVVRLRRTRIGKIDIGHLSPGESRPLTDDEIAELKRCAGEP